MIRLVAFIMYKIYGYEALNLLFRILPSKYIVVILRQFGAKIGNHVRILSPFCIHNADNTKPIFKNLIIGDEVFIGRFAFIDLADQVQIGDRTTISHYCQFHTHMDVGVFNFLKYTLTATNKPILINSDVYLGANTTVLYGVSICSKSIIGANSLVLKEIKTPGTYYGVPIKLKN